MKAKKYTDLYIDELHQVVHPDTAIRIINSGLNFTGVNIFGLKNFLSPFCNGDMGKEKLLKDINNGNVVILEDGKAFHGILDSNGMVSSSLSCSFHFKMELIQANGKVRPRYGLRLAEESEDVVAEYSPEPVVPETVSKEDNIKTEFSLGWMLVKKGEKKDDILKGLYPAKEQADKRLFIDRYNEHLGDYVRRGEIVVLPTTDPVSQEDIDKLKVVKAEALAAHRGLHSLPEEESNAVATHIPLLDYAVANEKKPTGGLTNAGQQVATWGGAINTGIGGQLQQMQSILNELDAEYIANADFIKKNKVLPDSLKDFRRSSFKKLDTRFHEMAFKSVGIETFPKVKHTLGLSTKSIVNNADELCAGGSVEALGQRSALIADIAKAGKWLGRGMVALDVTTSVSTVYEATQTEGGDAARVASVETGRVAMGYWGGELGASAATGLLGLLGCSNPVTGLFVVLLAAGGGGWIGGKGGELVGEVLYDLDSSDVWDWTAEQY